MTRSNPRTDPAALSAAFSGAVDLSALKRPTTPGPTAPAGSAAPAGIAVDVTEADFAIEVVEKSMQQLVIVDLWSARSPVSAQLSPVLEKVVAGYRGAIALARVDVDVSPRIGQAFGVQSIPTVVAVAAGQPVDAFTGAQPEAALRAWIQSLVDAVQDRLPGMVGATGEPAGPDGPAEPEPDPLVLQAEAALEEGDFDAAIAAYQQLADADPNDAEARSAVAQLTFQQRSFELPPDAVQRAAAAPDDLTAQFDAADLIFASGQIEQSFEFLIDVVGRFYGDDRNAARDHTLGLFALLGNDDPLVIKYRRRLAAALY